MRKQYTTQSCTLKNDPKGRKDVRINKGRHLSKWPIHGREPKQNSTYKVNFCHKANMLS